MYFYSSNNFSFYLQALMALMLFNVSLDILFSSITRLFFYCQTEIRHLLHMFAIKKNNSEKQLYILCVLPAGYNYTISVICCFLQCSDMLLSACHNFLLYLPPQLPLRCLKYCFCLVHCLVRHAHEMLTWIVRQFVSTARVPFQLLGWKSVSTILKCVMQANDKYFFV